MTESPSLGLSLVGRPPAVRLDGSRLPPDAWYRVYLLFEATQRLDTSIHVAPELLIERRQALKAIQQDHRFGITADDGVTSMLRGSLEDRKAFKAAMNGQPQTIGPACRTVRVVRRELRKFQVRDLERLSSLKHGANFSVPGAGKTTVSLALHAAALNAGLVDRLLVVAPYSAFGAWEEDAAEVLQPAPRVTQWRPGTQPVGDVVLVAYPQLPSAAPVLIGWMLTHRTHLILDEAHRAKRGTAGQWGAALTAMAPFAARRDILTGTPAPNHPKDLGALLDILWPGAGASSRLPAAAFRADPPARAMEAVQRVIRPLYVRTSKEELELPEAKIKRLPVTMGSLQTQIYSALRNQYAGTLKLDSGDQARLAMMGEVSMYLLQAASSPKLLGEAVGPRAYRYPPLAIPAGSRLAALIESYGEHEVPAKLEAACRIVHENARAKRKTLVWSNFPANLLDLEQQLAALQPALVYGGVPTDPDEPRSRPQELARFKNDDDCMVLLANPAAMSEGVSLHQVCHDAVYIDRTFNAGQYLQSLDRIHRLGLQPGTETRVTLLVAENTLDERVDIRVETKTKRLAQMLNDPALTQMALPDEDDTSVIDSDLDLAEVLEHLATGLPERT